MLRVYDENIFYHWTYGEWINRMQGAFLAEIDAQERAVQAAYIGAVVSREKKPQRVDKYFNAEKARKQALEGVSSETKKKADFTFYNKALEGLKGFNWADHYTPGNTTNER